MKKVLMIVFGIISLGMVGCTKVDNPQPNEQQINCDHEYTAVSWRPGSYSDGSNSGYDIYCPKCKWETKVSYKEWNKIQADMEYKKENK